MERRFLIIGNGTAGLTAAETIRKADRHAKILIVTDEPHPFYSRPGIAYLLAGDIPEGCLFPRTTEELEGLGLGVVHARAVQIDPSAQVVHFEGGRSLGYEALLLATGASAIRPPIAGVDLQGVVTFDTLDDARRILRLARRAKRAVVIGGGITALELAEGLTACGVETHYLLRKDRYWSRVLDEDESLIVEEGLAREGIVLHRNTSVEKILGRRGRVTGVQTDEGKVIKCQIVACAVGIRPRTELASSAGLMLDRGILVDEHMHTSARNVFAAGDVAQVYDPITGEHSLDTLWAVATEQGAAAGWSMVGEPRPFLRGTPFNVTRLGGVITTIIGSVGSPDRRDDDLVSIVRGDSERWRHHSAEFSVEVGEKPDRVRLMLNPDRIVGAVITGDQTASRFVNELISSQVDIRPIYHLLLRSPGRSLEIIARYIQQARLTPPQEARRPAIAVR